MADKDQLRYRYGITNPQVYAVDSATVIQRGDMVWQDTNDVKPASDVTYLSTLALTQEYFHDRFAGIAAQRSRSGDTEDIRVDSDATFEMDIASTTLENGQLLGPADDGGTALKDQEVVAVATANLAIGRAAKRYTTATTKVLVRIVSSVAAGGPQAIA